MIKLFSARPQSSAAAAPNMFAAGSGNKGADAAEEDASTFSVKRSDSLLSDARHGGDNDSSSGDAGPRALPGADPESVLRFGWSEYFRRVFRFLFWHKLMVLLVFVPIAMICHVSHANQGVIFATCMLGLIPLASAFTLAAVALHVISRNS